MLILPELILFSIGLFLVLGEPPKKEKEKEHEQELGEAIAKYLSKTKGNGSQS